MLKTMCFAAAAAALTSAASADAQTPRQLGAHVHGDAELAVALDRENGALLVELSGPAYNLYGFERAPQGDDEHAIVDAANARLQAGGLIAFSQAAGCSLVETAISGGPGGDHAHDDHGHDDHGHDGHDHDGHDHGQGGQDDDEHGHSDIVVSWTYACTQPAAINQIDAGALFEAFSGLERLEAQFFDGVDAAAGALTRERSVLQTR